MDTFGAAGLSNTGRIYHGPGRRSGPGGYYSGGGIGGGNRGSSGGGRQQGGRVF